MVAEVCAAVGAAKAKHIAAWPPSSGGGPSSPDENKKTNFDAPADETVRLNLKACKSSELAVLKSIFFQLLSMSLLLLARTQQIRTNF